MKKNAEPKDEGHEEVETLADIVIDPEFSTLIPPLTDAEYNELEESIVRDECREPLVLWGKTLIDGHNRHRVCIEHVIQCDLVDLEFVSRDAVKEWIIRNQFGRRNLTTFQRAELALKLKPIVAKRAKERQVRGGRKKVVQNSAQADYEKKTRIKLAAIAGVSHDTIYKAELIGQKADEQTKEKLRTGKTSINAVYLMIKPMKARPPHNISHIGDRHLTKCPWCGRKINQ